MEIINVNDELQLNDNDFLQLQFVIQSKRNMLLNKQKKLQRISKQNEFLNQVKNDYANYNNYIIKQKNEQLVALDLLQKYIKDLTISGELSENNLKDAKYEQNKIKKELKSIKHSLDDLMNETSK